MSKFKVGDIIRILTSIRSDLIGHIGIITYSDSSDVVKVRLPVDIKKFEEYWFMEEHLAPAQKDDHIKVEAFCKFLGYVENEYIKDDIKATYSLYKKCKRDAIKKVIFNNPATIVYWIDGTKTVVKCGNEDFDPEKGLAMAISKKALGNQGDYYEIFKKWLPKEDPKMSQMLVKAIYDNIMTAIGRNTEEYKCSTCARFDDENMSCMISNCEKYSKYVKKDTKEEPKRNPVQEAYDKLVRIRDHDEFCDFDELIGLLGEALDD